MNLVFKSDLQNNERTIAMYSEYANNTFLRQIVTKDTVTHTQTHPVGNTNTHTQTNKIYEHDSMD